MNKIKTFLPMAALACVAMLALPTSWAKLPAPSDEAKAKAAEAAAKAAHGGKVDAFKLCQSMETVATGYYANAKKAGMETKPPLATPPCADPGAFVYTPAPPPAAPTVAAASPAPATAAAPAAPAAPKK